MTLYLYRGKELPPTMNNTQRHCHQYHSRFRALPAIRAKSTPQMRCRLYKCAVAYIFESLGEGERPQRRTALKSALLYLFNTFGDDHRFESLTSLKRFAANGDNTAGNPYRSKVDAPLERKPGYFFTPSGITTDLREQHSSNAQSPISFTLFGISTD